MIVLPLVLPVPPLPRMEIEPSVVEARMAEVIQAWERVKELIGKLRMAKADLSEGRKEGAR